LQGGGIGNGRIAKANQEALKKAIISGVGKPWKTMCKDSTRFGAWPSCTQKMSEDLKAIEQN
jgi:hypothetical protein